MFSAVEGRHVVILLTDGYDENSSTTYDDAIRALQRLQATVYVVGIGGVAGISLKGETLLRRIARQMGGRAFFPNREDQLPERARHRGRRRLPPLPAELHAEEPGGRRHVPRHPARHRRIRSTASAPARATSRPSRRRSSRRSNSAPLDAARGAARVSRPTTWSSSKTASCRRSSRSRKRWRRSRSPW